MISENLFSDDPKEKRKLEILPMPKVHMRGVRTDCPFVTSLLTNSHISLPLSTAPSVTRKIRGTEWLDFRSRVIA